MDSVQARITALKNHAQARRQLKPIAGSNVHFVVTESPQYPIYMPAAGTGVKWLKFIPIDQTPGYFYFSIKSSWSRIDIVPGSIGSDGSVAIVVNAVGAYATALSTAFSIVAVGVTSGTFIEL